MTIQKCSVIIPSGANPELHEIETAKLLVKKLKQNVEFIVPTRTKGAGSADAQIDGVIWEFKCPHGSGKRTIEKQFHRASRQSQNLVIDLRYIKLSKKVAEDETEKQFKIRRGIKKLLVITKSEEIIDLVH